MNGFAKKVVRFLLEEEGPTAVEYAMAMLLILLACLTAVNVLGQSTANSFESSYNSIEQEIGGGS